MRIYFSQALLDTFPKEFKRAVLEPYIYVPYGTSRNPRAVRARKKTYEKRKAWCIKRGLDVDKVLAYGQYPWSWADSNYDYLFRNGCGLK